MSEVITVNASGLSCPQPVMLTRKALADLEMYHVSELTRAGVSELRTITAAVR